MQIDPITIILSTLGAGLLFWIIGRTLAKRIPPWKRVSWAVITVLIVVVAVIVANNLYQFLPRGFLRLVLMFSAAGWIFGVVGYRD
jgi:Na+/citrate or Na+/malate symporter